MKSSGKNAKGIGLGLCITKQICESFAGEVRVESKLGEGAKFTVVFQIDKPDKRETNELPRLNLAGMEEEKEPAEIEKESSSDKTVQLTMN